MRQFHKPYGDSTRQSNFMERCNAPKKIIKIECDKAEPYENILYIVHSSAESHPLRILLLFFYGKTIISRPISRAGPRPKSTLPCPEHLFHLQGPDGAEDVVRIHRTLHMQLLPQLGRLRPVRRIKCPWTIFIF